MGEVKQGHRGNQDTGMIIDVNLGNKIAAEQAAMKVAQEAADVELNMQPAPKLEAKFNPNDKVIVEIPGVTVEPSPAEKAAKMAERKAQQEAAMEAIRKAEAEKMAARKEQQNAAMEKVRKDEAKKEAGVALTNRLKLNVMKPAETYVKMKGGEIDSIDQQDRNDLEMVLDIAKGVRKTEDVELIKIVAKAFDGLKTAMTRDARKAEGRTDNPVVQLRKAA